MGMALMAMISCTVEKKWTEKQVDNFMLVSQEDAPALGYAPTSGVKLLTIDGFAFKDLNRNDSFDRKKGFSRDGGFDRKKGFNRDGGFDKKRGFDRNRGFDRKRDFDNDNDQD